MLPYPVNIDGVVHGDPRDHRAATITKMGESNACVTIASWAGAHDLMHTTDRPLLSLRGLLPECYSIAHRPMMALDVEDGHPVARGCFDAAVAWLSAHSTEDLTNAPVVCCWLGQSRSVVFTAVWYAYDTGWPFADVLACICGLKADAYPHVALVRSAYEWLGEDVPPELC